MSRRTFQIARVVAAMFCPLLATAQTAVTLSPAASPASGQPGITVINLTGSGFPTGTILPTAVTVSMAPSAGGAAITTPSSAVTTVAGTTRRVTFTIPASISVATPTSYAVSISGATTTNTAFASTNKAVLTVNPGAQILSVAPATGNKGQTVSVTITGAYTNFVQGSTVASFGAGIAVGGAAEGAPGPVTVSSATVAVAQLVIDPAASSGARNVTVSTGTQTATLTGGFSVTVATGGSLAITSFSPQTGPVGSLVTVNLSNFTPVQGTAPQVTLSKFGGGTISASASTSSANSLSFVVPAGAGSGTLSVNWGSQNATSPNAFTVTTSTTFTLGVGPSTAKLLPGQNVTYAITLNSTNGFDGLAALAVSGTPVGVQASFKPVSITAGQTSVLTVSAPGTQSTGTATLSISAAAIIDGQQISQSATAALQINAITTSFVGRTAVDNSQQTPLAGVTVKFLGKDASGNTTSCSGQTVSDAGGNFSFTQLPVGCTGPQLISYDGSTATAPLGKYAGVNLSYTLTSGQVTTSPVLIHLPRIDNAETVQVQQNASTNQVFNFQTIPGLVVTVYAGTTFSLDDGSQPNPFPLIAMEVPVDRLPDAMPSSGVLMPFIVAFQPANAMSSQPVAVNFPNSLNMAPGGTATFMTLDPTRGFMVPYGTGTVSTDGTKIIADADPAHPGHGYGLVHFDWHGPTAPDPPTTNPCPTCTCTPGATCTCPITVGQPVDASSGLDVITASDIAINGPRGSVSATRTIRTLDSNAGPFGTGSYLSYSYQLGTFAFIQGQGVITLVMPNGSQFPLNLQQGGTFVNTTIPSLRGVVLTNPSSGVYSLRWKDGTIYQFQSPAGSGRVAYLTSITDANGNATTLALNAAVPGQITQITDPVGRSLNLTYDSSNRVTSISDPIGRIVRYTYNSQNRLATVTDPAGGITQYAYDSNGHLTSVTDPRGVVTEQNTFDSSGRVIQQVQADGGVYNFAYTLLNPLLATSPVLQTVVTDPLGNQTIYRFSPLQLVTDVTDPAGQTTTFSLDADHNNLVSGKSGTAACAPCGDPGQGSETFTLDTNGNILTSTDSLGNTTTFTYDPNLNKVLSITDPLGHVTTLTYDSAGNVMTRTDPNHNITSFAYNSFGQVTQLTDSVGNKTTFSYDGFGNLVSTTDSIHSTTSYAFDGVSRVIQTTDALGRQSSTSYDALDRVTSQTDAQGNTTQFTYDKIGNVLSVTDAKGNRTSFTYDGINRLLTKTDPLGHADIRTYDAYGNLTKFVDRRGQTSSFVYNSRNQLIDESYVDATVVRSYDVHGRLANITDSVGGSFAFTYDAVGHLVSSVNQFGAVQYAFDAGGHVISRQVVGQPALAYSYDNAGNLTSASLAQSSVTFVYDGDNRLTNLTRANGVNSQRMYDSAGRLLLIKDSGGQGISSSHAYSYDAVGDAATHTTTLAQGLTTQPVVNTFGIGNRLLTSGVGTYSYDGNGNLTSAITANGTTTYTWDGRNRLASILASGQTTSFTYDFKGALISQADAGTTSLTKKFVLDDITNVAYISQSNGDSLSVLAGRSIDEHLAIIHSGGQVEYGLTDAINSTTQTVDQNGSAVSSVFYEPFGLTTTAGSYPFQFTGRTLAGTNLYYYRARFYSPPIGRFISEDPIGLNAGPNVFAYVQNAPTAVSDPLGLAPPGDFLACVVTPVAYCLDRNYTGTCDARCGKDFGEDQVRLDACIIQCRKDLINECIGGGRKSCLPTKKEICDCLSDPTQCVSKPKPLEP